jgi:hypothetical protein
MTINHEEAQEAAELGIKRAADHAEREGSGWVEEAAEALGWAATQHLGPEFTIEQLRQLTTQLPDPPDLRAWGAATQRAARLGYIVKTSNFALAASSNNSPKPLYVQGAWR